MWSFESFTEAWKSGGDGDREDSPEQEKTESWSIPAKGAAKGAWSKGDKCGEKSVEKGAEKGVDKGLGKGAAIEKIAEKLLEKGVGKGVGKVTASAMSAAGRMWQFQDLGGKAAACINGLLIIRLGNSCNCTDIMLVDDDER